MILLLFTLVNNTNNIESSPSNQLLYFTTEFVDLSLEITGRKKRKFITDQLNLKAMSEEL